ncbi:glycosyltransferase [Halomicrococcus sp. SG-WS-1]|uniref:glycosyltransferase n=1 Tax=Halomicrococcus sp. SG-WS-1 TaxID=3439057 RepID=UPI003F78D957
MPSTVAVAHYPEGAGHATRMVAIANALEASGAEVLMAGGGAGTEFVALNGYDEFEPAVVDYVDTYQEGSLGRVVSESVPASADRVTDYVGWLRETDPDALVTDDMFAAMAAQRTGTPLYVVKHDAPGLYRDRLERTGAAFHTKFQLATAREFFYPAVWSPSDIDPANATRVPPVALGGDGEAVDAPDVVLVPSYFSELDRVADLLERRGYDVLDVSDDDWEPVPSLLPYIRGADAVVCSGYSTVMDAAVAGTPCVVVPATGEQEAVAEMLDRSDTAGFAVADEPLDVLDAVSSPPDAPAYENGADVVAEQVLDDLQEAEDDASSLRGVASAARSNLVGRGERAAGASVAAVGLAGVVAQQVAARNSYLRIERSLPTYAGGVSELFLVAAVAIVAVAALGAAVDAGLVPSILLASGPVVGWATNHWASAVAPHYAVTFPLEMALLYGGVLGTVGYVLGTGLRELTPSVPWASDRFGRPRT